MEIAILPRFIIRKIVHDDASQIHVNVLISSFFIILVLLLLHSNFNHLASIPNFCISQNVFHLPCPGCGITRSLFSTSRGDVFLAWQYNPAGLVFFLFLLAQIPMRLVAITHGDLSKIISKISRIGSLFVILSLVLVWILRIVY